MKNIKILWIYLSTINNSSVFSDIDSDDTFYKIDDSSLCFYLFVCILTFLSCYFRNNRYCILRGAFKNALVKCAREWFGSAVMDRKRSWIRANKPSASWPSFSLISERALLSSRQLFYQWFDTPKRKILRPRVCVNIDHRLLLAAEYSIIFPISWSGAYTSSGDNVEMSVTL